MAAAPLAVVRIAAACLALVRPAVVRLAAVCLAAAIVLPAVARGAPAPQAADPSGVVRDSAWVETPARHFVILTDPAGGAAREHLAARADGVYDALALVFAEPLDTPLTLRVFASLDDYRAANPLAFVVDGVADAGRHGRREIDLVAGTGTGAGLDAGALDNALRRALAYRFVARVSGDRMAGGFRNGIAQYLEEPGDRHAPGVARLREAVDQARLHAWADLNAPGAVYQDPALMLPENLSVAHFLVTSRGLERLLAFARASRDAPGWRHALEAVYGESPSALEAAWRAWLPSYLDGGWRQHALYARDVAAAEALIARGAYAAAVAQLEGMASLLATTDPAAAGPARALLARAVAGRDAVAAAEAAGLALAAGDYASAAAAAATAEATLAEIGDAPGRAFAAEVASRAAMGVAAEASLRRAERLPPWRMLEARQAAYAATTGYARLGNDAAAARARDRLAHLDARLAPAGAALLALGVGLLAWNVRRRRRDRAAGAGTGPLALGAARR